MKIKSVEKVVRVHAEVQTDLGEFHVFETGEVRYFDGCKWNGEHYMMEDDILEQIQEAGMNMLHFNKGV